MIGDGLPAAVKRNRGFLFCLTAFMLLIIYKRVIGLLFYPIALDYYMEVKIYEK